MLAVFYDVKDVVYKESLPQEQAFNTVYYVDILEHDNAPCRTFLRVREFLAKYNVVTLRHGF